MIKIISVMVAAMLAVPSVCLAATAEASDNTVIDNTEASCDSTGDKSRFYIHLSGRTDVAGLPIKHNERIVVPVFGRQQETRPDGKGGLDK